MKKWQLESSENSEISEKLFRVFYFRVFDFALQPKSKTWIKNLEKKFPRFPSFRPGPYLTPSIYLFMKESTVRLL